MMKKRTLIGMGGATVLRVGLLCCLMVAGCAGLSAGAGVRDRVLSNGYSLLHDLVSKQSQVGGILILKSASRETESLIKAIAKASQDADQKIQRFVEKDDRLTLHRPGLPQIEQATRDKIESATAQKLLFAGDGFELELLLTQFEATKYGSYLAGRIAREDTHDAHREWLENFSKLYAGLHEQVVARLTDHNGSSKETNQD